MDSLGLGNVQGQVRAHRVQDEIWTPCTQLKPNLVVYEWTKLVSKLLTTGDSRYRIAGMYLEFENKDNSGDTISIPTFDRTRDVTYYNALSGSTRRDYLRVPLTANQVLSAGTGLTQNQLIFFARSSGVAGVHNKSFASANNSTIFGASLVAFVDATDATRDLIFSSFYFAASDQQQKLPTSQVGLEWQVTLQ